MEVGIVLPACFADFLFVVRVFPDCLKSSQLSAKGKVMSY